MLSRTRTAVTHTRRSSLHDGQQWWRLGGRMWVGATASLHNRKKCSTAMAQSWGALGHWWHEALRGCFVERRASA